MEGLMTWKDHRVTTGMLLCESWFGWWLHRYVPFVKLFWATYIWLVHFSVCLFCLDMNEIKWINEWLNKFINKWDIVRWSQVYGIMVLHMNTPIVQGLKDISDIKYLRKLNIYLYATYMCLVEPGEGMC